MQAEIETPSVTKAPLPTGLTPHEERVVLHLTSNHISRFSELKAIGATSRMLKRLVDRGVIEKYEHGTYAACSETRDMSWISLAVLSARHPEAVICLTTAAAYHDLTVSNPPEVSAAFPYESSIPNTANNVISGHRWRGASMEVGIDEVTVFGTRVKITSPARTVVDLLRTANRTGEKELAMEALRSYNAKGLPLRDLGRVAKKLSQLPSVQPYIEAAQAFR